MILTLDQSLDSGGKSAPNLLPDAMSYTNRHLGKDIKPEQQEEGRKKLEIFRTWFQENVMRTDERTLSDAVLIMPNGRAVPKYRDDHNG